MNIEKYGFERSDLVVVTAVNAYLKKLTPEARRETLSEIVKQGGVIDGPGACSPDRKRQDCCDDQFGSMAAGEREIIRRHLALSRSSFLQWTGKSMRRECRRSSCSS